MRGQGTGIGRRVRGRRGRGGRGGKEGIDERNSVEACSVVEGGDVECAREGELVGVAGSVVGEKESEGVLRLVK